MTHRTTALEDVYDFILSDDFDQETPQTQAMKNFVESLFNKDMQTHKNMRKNKIFFSRLFPKHPMTVINQNKRKRER